MAKAWLVFALVLIFGCVHEKPKPPPGRGGVDAVLVNGPATLSTQAPSGWLFDETLAIRLDVCAFYFLDGSSFDESPGVLYTRASEFVGQEGIDRDEREVTRACKLTNPACKVEKQPAYTSKHGLKFQIEHFLDGPRANRYEAVGYTILKNHVFAAVYSSLHEEDFKKHLPEFYAYLDLLEPLDVQLYSFEGKCLYPGANGKLESHEKKAREIPFMDNI